jgi:hypothetical protein
MTCITLHWLQHYCKMNVIRSYIKLTLYHNSVLKGHFVTLEADDEQGIHAARGFACEAVATRFISGLADREIIDSLLYELEIPDSSETENTPVDSQLEALSPVTEQSPLLSRSSLRSRGSYRGRLTVPESYDGVAEDPSADTDSELAEQFDGLNALEIAAVSGAKKFLCQKPVQRIINAIWTGDIMFWNKLSADAQKKAQIYQRKNLDPFCRLRVPISQSLRGVVLCGLPGILLRCSHAAFVLLGHHS